MEKVTPKQKCLESLFLSLEVHYKIPHGIITEVLQVPGTSNASVTIAPFLEGCLLRR
jgi:hypothetical protein